MFNNLNPKNSSRSGSVDDIFAETDSPENGSTAFAIETKTVGLASANYSTPEQVNNQSAETPLVDEMSRQMLHESHSMEKNANRGYMKTIIIVLFILFLGAAAYFAYFNFFTNNEPSIDLPFENNTYQAAPANQLENNGFVEIIPENIANLLENEDATGSDGSSEGTTPQETELIEGVDNESGAFDQADSDFINFVDSDGDGLSDEEEAALGTNPNIIDTDNDGLTDYEEVKIYLTNPLNPDTDGDSYLDGAEVKSGYDPNVVGAKLPGNN